MSKITAELLREMVGIKRGRALIDQLVDPLNLVLPAYGITTEYRIAAFLGTAAPESDWFKTLREYGKGAGRAYGKPNKITGLIYYGRGIFQNTWIAGYRGFTEYVAENWNSIKARARKYGYTNAPDFVHDPELLATPYWAVEAACWYWKVNGLVKYADRGLVGFFGLEGRVNRGDETKRALGYPDRLHSYEIARRLIADDFNLNGDSLSADTLAAEPEPGTAQTATEVAGGGTPTAANPSSSEQSPTQSETIVAEKTTETDEGSVTEKIISKAETAGDKFQSFQGVLDKFGFSIEDAKRSIGTVLFTGFKVVLAGVMVIWGMFKAHPEIFIPAALGLIVLAYFLWDRSGKRVAEAKAGMPVAVAKAVLAEKAV